MNRRSLGWTSIQWTWEMGPDGVLIPMSGSTWNPLLGCRRASPGCENCYAERLIAVRMSKNPMLPMYHDIARENDRGEPRFTGNRRLLPDRLDAPLRARKARKIFVCDMGDLFFEGHPFEEIAAVFVVMLCARQHTFQVLTKRAKRMAEFFAWLTQEDGWRERWGAAFKLAGIEEFSMCFGPGVLTAIPPESALALGVPWPLPNVWLGVSVEDRERKSRIDVLRDIPAAVRFLSVEPLLEDLGEIDLRGIHLVIVGGESGPNARPFDEAWPTDLLAQARAAGTSFFMKQFGARPMMRADSLEERRRGIHPEFEWPDGTRFGGGAECGEKWRGRLVHLRDPHGGEMGEWPERLRIREFPFVRAEKPCAATNKVARPLATKRKRGRSRAV